MVIAIVIVILLVVAIVIVAAILYDRFRYQSELGPPPSRKGSMRLVSLEEEENLRGGKGRVSWREKRGAYGVLVGGIPSLAHISLHPEGKMSLGEGSKELMEGVERIGLHLACLVSSCTSRVVGVIGWEERGTGVRRSICRALV